MLETSPTLASLTDDQAQRVRDGLDKVRLRLLDLTSRNKLISFRHTSSTIRIVDVALDVVYGALVSGTNFPLVYVPEPTNEELTELDEKPTAKEYAAGLGWAVGYDLPPGQGRVDRLPTLHFKDEFDSLVRKVNTTANTTINESGVNLLHLVFGFLEWRESDDSTQVRYAPLIVLPVKLELPKSTQEDRAVQLSCNGEDLTANLSLIEKMRRDFGIELPQLGEGEQPTGYFARVQGAVRHKREWRICRQMSIGLLSFAKLLMYLDLDSERWPESALAKHPRLLDVFAQNTARELSFAAEYELDEEAKRVPLPDLVCDADSSQHSALLDASRGNNLVIEGPPGTGKSQTITNLIAASLAQGKRVLFVAEKMAALEVVKRRLDHARLGDFCLELHSHKTNKVGVLSSLDGRIRAQPSFSDPVLLDYRTTTLENLKEELTRYVKLLNEPFGALLKSPFDVIWARDAVRERLHPEAAQTSAITFPGAKTWDPAGFEARRNKVEVYGAHLRRYAQSGGAVEKALNPWSWLPTTELSLTKQEALLCQLTSLRELCEAQIVLLQAFVENFALVVSCPEAWFDELSSWTTAVQISEGSCNYDLLESLVLPETRDRLSGFLAEVARYRADKEASTLADLLADGKIARKSGTLMEALERRGIASFTLGNLATIVEKTAEARSQSASAASALSAVGEALEVEATFSMQYLNQILTVRSLMNEAPTELLHRRGQCFEREGFGFRLRKAQKECDDLLEQQRRCAADFDLERPTTLEALEQAAVILEDTPWFKRFFSTPFRNAKQLFTSLSLQHRGKTTPSQMTHGLRYLAGQLKRVDVYRNNYAKDPEIGPLFEGLATPWSELIRLADWYEEVMVRLPAHVPCAEALQRALFDLPVVRLRCISEGSAEALPSHDLAALSAALAALHRHLPQINFEQSVSSIGGFLLEAEAAAELSRTLLQTLAPLHLPATTSATSLREHFEQASKLRGAREALNSATEVKRLLGRSFKGAETECSSVEAMLTFAARMMETALPNELKLWLMHAEYDTRSGWLRKWLLEHHENATRIAAAKTEIEAVLDKPLKIRLCDKVDELERAKATIDASLNAAPLLSMWIDVCHSLKELETLDLHTLIEGLSQKGLPTEKLADAFEYHCYDSLIRLLFNEHPALWRLSGTTHEETRRKFADLDKAVIGLTQLRVSFAASRARISAGIGGRPKEKTDLALIQHEISKQRSHIPVRQLLSRAGRAVQALKPCFMMSPMSVAQFLEPGTLQFDLVVMDEASQLRPEDALGAIARGTQLVVVGDPKQLPPTSFFQKTVADEEDEDERTVADDSESILDISLSLYQPVRRLRWHYRSQHHSLIAFSNSEFYDNNLVVFPSAYHQHPDLGVKFVSVAGVFERRRNQLEAERVVDAILEHMQTHPSESLGIVTMNFDQRELIEALLYARLQNDSYASMWVEQREETAEPFFIKNLENVQGDERDVIFISVTYGPDSQGSIFQRFSGVNSQSGHRRLNVMVTRAKKRTVVFSSLEPNDINVTPSSPWGVRALKAYLDFAKAGISSQPLISPGAEPSNEHEAAIGMLLKESGFEVVPQVGVSGYFIDLAVRHPNKPGTFLLGIEFDGKSYHSGRSARDRDRLRQVTLERQGWKIHRIWSTDWFKNRDAEVTRLLRKVRDLSTAVSAPV